MKHYGIIPILLMLLLLSGCKKETTTEFSFSSTIEQPTNDDGSKVYLLDERWIYWEVGDEITIGSDVNSCNGEEQYTAHLVNTSNYSGTPLYDDIGAFNGVFITTMEYGSQYFLGLHPKSDNNVIIPQGVGSWNFSTIKIDVPSEQPLRTDDRADYTFGKDVVPMVAWYGGEWTSPETAYNLDFHSLAAIVRIQLFDESNSPHTIDSIEIISSDDTQLSGLFNVINYKTEDPHLSSAANTEDNRKIVLADNNVTLDSLRSFYLVLPAYKGRHENTTFNLTMKAYATTNETALVNFTVTTRRNAITNMRAIGLTNWSNPVQGIVGNGTSERPFKVYTVRDLQYLRNCFEESTPKINGIVVTESTEIRIMRSDIVLDATSWGTSTTNNGIKNFKGHIKYAGAQNSSIITLKTDIPLFHNIAAGGKVEGINIICNTSISYGGEGASYDKSLFCRTNNGTIKDCAISTSTGNTITAASSNIAGICADNLGTIEGCRCEASIISSDKNAAGICYNNSGTIKGCHVTSTMTISAPNGNAAGICYLNTGDVRDSYFATRITNGDCNWGAIVYDNQGLVEHCYMSSTGHITTASTKSVGGIVHDMSTSDSKINYCWNESSIEAGIVGGLAVNVTGGTIINSFTRSPGLFEIKSSTGFIGGLVATLNGGNVYNSYVKEITLINNQLIGGMVAGVVGNATSGEIKNCYTKESTHTFYGTNAGATIQNCHNVDGTAQTGISSVNSSTNDAYTTLATTLNTNRPDGIGCKEWISNTNTPPILESYSSSK